VVELPEAANFKKMAHLYGLKPEHLNQKFVYHGEEYELTGLNARARSAPFLATRCNDGKRFKFKTMTVVLAFDKQ
jgi:hypothetical protein